MNAPARPKPFDTPPAIPPRHGFWAAWRATWWTVLRDRGVLLVLAIAPVLYGFFYPWPYQQQAVTRVPVAIVDLDNSGLSRQIARFASASPQLDVLRIAGDERELSELLWTGRIEGYAVLPRGLKRQVLRGQPSVVSVAGNGAYALLNKAVLSGFAQAVGTVSAGIEIRQLQAGGMARGQAMQARQPLGLHSQALFNPTEGYGSYVVPAVALLILQQTLMIGAAMLAAGWFETGVLRAPPSAWLGRVATLSTVGLVSGLFYFGWVFYLQDYPRPDQLWRSVVLLLCYGPAVSAMGLLMGSWVRDRERSLQLLLLPALPFFFLSGAAWPVEALPAPLQFLRWLIPSTSGIEAALALNQMGASLAEVRTQLGVLLAQTVLALAALSLLAPVRRQT